MWFTVYYDYMFSIVDLFLYSCMDTYSTHLDLLLTWVSGRDGVSVGDNHRGPPNNGGNHPCLKINE
jgi:hypothetical protein